MNILDIIISLPIAYGLIRGLFRGLVKELTTLVSLFVAIICAKLYAPTVALYLQTLVTWSQQICEAVAYSAIFIVVAMALNIIGRLLSKMLSAISLGGINKLLGAVFGAGKWILIMMVIITIVNIFDERFHFIKDDVKQSSVIYPTMQKYSEIAWKEAQEIIN